MAPLWTRVECVEEICLSISWNCDPLRAHVPFGLCVGALGEFNNISNVEVPI